MNLLFLNVGRRCELVESFKSALTKRGGGTVYGSDISPLAPALQVVDRAVIFPKADDPSYSDFLTSFCAKNSISLLIPTIDPDLTRLDSLREEFRKKSPETRLLLSSTLSIQHARDKNKSKALFEKLGATTPKGYRANDRELSFPVFVKPVDGSSGIGAEVVHSPALLLELLQKKPSLMIEEVIEGPEYTVDVLCDFEGKPLIAVPRKRIKVRGGEVTQAVIERSAELEELSKKMAQGFEARGPVTLQFRKRSNGDFVAIELNARMGGGLPLTIAAGADWCGWVLDLAQGKLPNVAGAKITDGMIMTRADRSFFLNPDQIHARPAP